MAIKKPNGPTPVEAVKHNDTRVNIPTEELRNFVRDDEHASKVALYPRDPSLDPQLVWKGKDEQDREDLAVPAVPIYIQEKIHPQALVENLRETAKKGETEPELSLFNDFNGITEFDQKIDFYNHEQHWTNRMILGDSMLVMNSLAEKEGLKGKVQMIYIDPPYGIRFGSNWQVSTRKRDVKDGSAVGATRQPEQIKAFRDTWQLGIHSYLAYLRDRLVLARELLTETGSIFVQISDENVHRVRCLLDEVFGDENFVVTINFKKKGNQKGGALESITDYILFYAKNKDMQKYRPVFLKRAASSDGFVSDQLTSGGLRANQNYDYVTRGRTFMPAAGNCWKILEHGMRRVEAVDRLLVGRGQIRFKKLDTDFGYTTITNNWDDTGGADDLVYVVQTGTKAIERCIQMTTDPGDLVLDPTCGGGTTAFVAEQCGRRWITVDTSRVALALSRTRLMAARYPYYLLSDSPEGVMKEAEITGKIPPEYKTQSDIKKGFVYRRVPHITLGSIANNEEIDTIQAKWREKLEPIRAKINKTLGKNWEEWDIPRDTSDAKLAPAKALIEEWWKLRCERQKEIDASISRAADTELLYDQPYEDNKRVRFTGPFTVESLSPHRRFSVEEKTSLKEDGIAGVSMTVMGAGQFALTIIDNLKKAGVQNTFKGERLKFDRLETFAGEWIHAAGEYTEGETSKRVAVCIGPEFGTVGPELIKEAAKEAVRGIGFDTLIVCGFAFEPSVTDEAKQYGNLNVLITRMNADLMMGEELLKKTGAGNLFMVFGEPDINIDRTDDGKVIVKINGLDVYDPTTGEIRSNTTDDIACWFIDTDYNEESFIVRHAYFTGAGDPYDKLRRALRADIDESAWASLYSTESRPFDPPAKGKIAVKVINHYGDEVLKVYEVK